LLAVATLAAPVSAGQRGPEFTVSVDPALRREPLTGRVFVFVSRRADPEPRLQYDGLADTVPLFGADVALLPAGRSAVLDSATPGYPLATPRDLPPGDYVIQALANVYTRFPRADGNTIWAHNDRGEGQKFAIAPGNLVSLPVRVRIEPARAQRFALRLVRALPALPPAPDTAFVKHVRLQSALLSKFWGVPMYLGAIVLLPKDYDAQRDRRYPAVYVQGHYSFDPPFGFDPGAQAETRAEREARLDTTNAESAYEFTRAWMRGDAPPMVAIAFEHPTPYYDDSYAVNSANNGPYGDALMTELIPHLEAQFHLLANGASRFLIGESTGGWEALALQIFHPDAFNGAWALYPDPVDFHRLQIGDMYADTSAFTTQRSAWSTSEIPAQRTRDGNTVATVREESRLELVLGSHGRSGEQFNAWDAAYDPVLQDGYPGEMWDKRTGLIDHDVIAYMREHDFDLRDYLERNWSRIGPSLAGKLHVDVGDEDDYFLNLACYRLQSFLDATANPAAKAVFSYGRPMKPHGWQAKSNLDYLRDMAARAGRPASTTP
jgi:S-formylglutathione hydrolase FrmB